MTLLVGENGSGKSTLLELIASSAGSITFSGEDTYRDETESLLKLVWSIRTKKGFYVKARDYSDFIELLQTIKRETREILAEIEARDPHSGEALPHRNTLADLKRLYGNGLEYRSHGESFLDLFQARSQPGGLYILDEPDAQFIIATHSPILMAFPGAKILEPRDGILYPTRFDQLEHVPLTRDFLQEPERYLRHL